MQEGEEGEMAKGRGTEINIKLQEVCNELDQNVKVLFSEILILASVIAISH